jgi:hypothetical protein
MWFELLSSITETETIAVGTSIREINRLRKRYGVGRWRKRKGIAKMRLADDTICMAELHWYEAHGIGKKEIRVKSFWEQEDEQAAE